MTSKFSSLSTGKAFVMPIPLIAWVVGFNFHSGSAFLVDTGTVSSGQKITEEPCRVAPAPHQNPKKLLFKNPKIEKGKDPDPYLRLTDPGGPKNADPQH
jgi:hypothetical protein